MIPKDCYETRGKAQYDDGDKEEKKERKDWKGES